MNPTTLDLKLLPTLKKSPLLLMTVHPVIKPDHMCRWVEMLYYDVRPFKVCDVFDNFPKLQILTRLFDCQSHCRNRL